MGEGTEAREMIFSPKGRDKAIETTCLNLIMAGLLPPCGTLKYMTTISQCDDDELVLILVKSRLALEDYYESNARARRN